MKKEKKNAEELLNEALSALNSGKPLEGKDGAVTPLIKHLTSIPQVQSLMYFD